MPGWLQTLAIYNPITYAADGMRTLMNSGFDTATLVKSFLVLGAVALAMMGIATILFRRRLV